MTGALSAGTGSIEIPVLCLLVNGDPGILEVGRGRGEGAWRAPLGQDTAWDRAPLVVGPGWPPPS